MDYAFLSDIGKSRMNNEDCIVIDDSISLFIISDGMGGANAGEYASVEACDVIKKYIYKNMQYGQEEIYYNKITTDAIKKANETVYKISITDKSKKGMGCTILVFLIVDDKCYIQHVGDTRAYLLRDSKGLHLTTDHTLVQKMVDDEIISMDEAKNHELKHVLTQSIGLSTAPDVAVKNLSIQEGDIFLLCTDGLHDHVEEEFIIDTVLNNAPQKAVEKLIKKANQNGGRDNCSAIVIKL